jgi:hypothetical protein
MLTCLKPTLAKQKLHFGGQYHAQSLRRHTNPHLLVLLNDRIEHVKKVQKAKSNVMKTGKMKVKSAAHKMVDVVSPSSGNDDNPESWKKDVLEGRRKKIENEEEADAKIYAQTDSEQMRRAESLKTQADDNQKKVSERQIDGMPAGPGRCSATHNPETPSPEEPRKA